MFAMPTLVAFLLASSAIILAPGPAQAFVLTRTLSEGRQAGILTAFGLDIGTVVHAFAAALGLSAILATSALAFAVMKYLGASYLVYVGIQALRTKTSESHLAIRAVSSPIQALAKATISGT